MGAGFFFISQNNSSAHGVTIETHTGGGIGTCQGRRLPNGRRSLSLSILEEIPLIEVTCDI